MKLLFPHKHTEFTRSFGFFFYLSHSSYFFPLSLSFGSMCVDSFPSLSKVQISTLHFFLLLLLLQTLRNGVESFLTLDEKKICWRTLPSIDTLHFVTFYSRACTSFSYQLCMCTFFYFFSSDLNCSLS